jgi:AcrR family transcriptional regulator
MARSAGIDRARVVEAAAELADARGLESLTLAAVAEQLHVRLPSLYNHIDGLGGLRRELALLGARELAERLRNAAVGVAGEAAVLALANAYRAYILQHPGRYAATVRAPAAEDEEFQRLAQTLIDTFRAVLAAYELAGDDALHTIRGLRSLTHGFASLELAGGFGLPLDRDESYRRLLRAYLVGLKRFAIDN